jgi:hypothetical protein
MKIPKFSPETFITDEQFIAFCEVRCESALPLFTSEQIIRMMQLARVEPKLMPIGGTSHLMVEEMAYMCQQARFHIAKADHSAGRKFDERRFRHLSLVVNNER